jgi:type III pantothenate kinase
VKGLAQKPSRPALVELNSAHHNMVWAYTCTSIDSRSGASDARTSPLIVADVGNSRIKFASFKDSLRDGGPQWVSSMASLSVGSPTQAELQTFMADLTTCLSRVGQSQLQSQPQPQLGWPIHILSVNPQAAQVLTENLSQLGFRALMVQKRTSLLRPSGIKPYDFNQLGIDRIAAMEGFLAGLTAEERRRQSLGIVISAGTATTIDFVSTAGDHWGGVILPGLEFSLRMLHQETGLLPRTTPVAGAIDLGSDTLGALRQGVMAMTVGAVNTLRHEVRRKSHGQRKECAQDEILVVTGGLGDLLTEHLGASRYEKDLVLCGTRSMVLSGA